jgi:peptidoglycan hydrolase-like protein with peptidoglycan-binding domain
MSQDLSELVEFEPANETAQRANGSHHRPIDNRIGPNNRRWPWLMLGALVGVGATIAISSVGDSDVDSAPAQRETIELSVNASESRDLIESVEWSGALAVGTSVVIDATTTGVVTAAADTGVLIERGDIIAIIGSDPVVALYGTVPMWRDLSDGDVGADVRQLETNLVALGYDPDGTVTIDDEYTTATETMVEAWQEALGVEATGTVARSSIAVLVGPSTVDQPAVIGSTVRPDTQLVVVDGLNRSLDVAASRSAYDDDQPGLVTAVAEIGTEVEQGTVLYEVDGVPASVLVEVDVFAEAVLAAFDTGDVEQIENVLVFLGFDPDGAIVADEEADLATAAAVARWQESAGLTATGSTDPDHYLVIPEADQFAFVVATRHVEIGDVLGEGRVVLTLAAATLAVTADVAISEIDEFGVGDAARVVQLDETEFDVVVAEISDVATEATQGQDSEPTVGVTFELVDEPGAFVPGSITIVTESARIDNATVVPTRALITLQEGGFAVEIVDSDGSGRLVGVDLGVFDEGWVEITNDAFAPGTEVIVPS